MLCVQLLWPRRRLTTALQVIRVAGVCRGDARVELALAVLALVAAVTLAGRGALTSGH